MKEGRLSDSYGVDLISGATEFSGDLVTFAEMTFRRNSSLAYLQTVVPEDRCKNGLQEVKLLLPWTMRTSAHRQSRFTAQKMKSRSRQPGHDFGDR